MSRSAIKTGTSNKQPPHRAPKKNVHIYLHDAATAFSPLICNHNHLTRHVRKNTCRVEVSIKSHLQNIITNRTTKNRQKTCFKFNPSDWDRRFDSIDLLFFCYNDNVMMVPACSSNTYMSACNLQHFWDDYSAMVHHHQNCIFTPHHRRKW